MQFALLAPDEAASSLAEAALQSGLHELTAVYGAPVSTGAAVGLHQAISPSEPWERLLHDPASEVVVIGAGNADHGNSDLRAEQLRKLVQAGTPLIVTHPAGDVLLGFEMQMIQRDSGSPVIPYLPELSHPLMTGLSRICGDGDRSVGKLRQLVIERESGTGDRAAVLNAFARDALLIRRLAGRIDRLSALGSQPHPATDWGNLSVHMTAHDGTIVRWSVSPGPSRSGRFSLAGDIGRVTCTISPDRAEWRHDVESTTGLTATWADDSAIWPFQLMEDYSADTTTVDALWDDACRAVELADTIEASCRRGKTIELHHEDHTEEETFKGMMAAGGCLTLLATLFLIILFSIVDSLDLAVFKDPTWQQWPWKLLHIRMWPVYLLGALGGFLVLQGLRAVFWTSDGRR